jgi:hypothetical protein
MTTGFIGEQDQTVSLPVVDGDETGPGDDTGGSTAILPVVDTEVDTLALQFSVDRTPVETPAKAAPAPVTVRPVGGWIRRVLRESAIYATFAAIAFWVTNQYWIPGHITATDAPDQAFFEVMMAHAAWAVTHFQNPLFMTQLNVPIGVNLMANTSVLAFSIPLAPITLWFGPAASYAFMMTFGLAATAAAWYHVLSRHVVKSRSAAVVGGLIAGFGPGMISHANGHPNIIAQFLLPFIAWRVVRLREPGRAVRNGVALALLVTLQFFINEEVLFLGGLGIGLMIIGFAFARRRTVRAEIIPFAKGAGVAVGVAAVLLAYPAWYQFFGPAAYHGLDPSVKLFSTDIAAFPAFAARTVFGNAAGDRHLSRSVAEQNSFFGWPLLLVLAVSVYWLRRKTVARVLAAVALVLSVLSLGQTITFRGHSTGIPGPWRLLLDLPLFDSAVPTRITLFVLPIIAVLVALGHDRAMALRRSDVRDVRVGGNARMRSGQVIVAWCVLLGIALVSIVPTSIPTTKATPTPAFFADGIYQQYVTGAQTVLPVPLPNAGVVDAMFWQAQAKLAFPMSRGYFLGPDPAKHDVAAFGSTDRPTSVLLDTVERTDKPAVVRHSDRVAALTDLRYWKVSVIIEQPTDPSELALRQTISELVGIKPKLIGGVWVWDVRALVNAAPNADLE